jgi:hypothetical protein
MKDYKIGFILVTHGQTQQIHKLVMRLNQMFESPPIVCHHDFFKSPIDTKIYPDNVNFVKPHVKTGWGKFSVVEATLKALELLYKDSISPDWFVLLSGSDYPIKPASKILEDLSATPYDVHINYKELSYGQFKKHERLKDSWQRVHFKRYFSKRVYVYYPDVRKGFKKRKIRLVHPVITWLFTPFSRNFPCYSGEHWFCANRKAAKYLLEFHSREQKLANYFRKIDYDTVSPDEAYYHTIFCNATHLKVSDNNLRYVDWSVTARHPKTLTFEDFPKLQKSQAHFARKFDLESHSELLDVIDKLVTIK